MLELFTFRISHFSEKSRWCLDASGAQYRETCWTPFFHVLPALRRGRLGTTVPILRTPQGYVQDSTRILHWIDQHQPGCTLLPQDAQQRREVLEIEERFDRVGAHVIRYAYSVTLDDAPAVIELWTLDANTMQRRIIGAAFPLLRGAFRRKLRLSPQSVAQSRQRIGEAVAFLDQRLADGRSYLVGDRLSAADITAAALLAPLAGPSQHEIYAREDFRAALEPLVREWNNGAAFEWVRGLYRRERRATP